MKKIINVSIFFLLLVFLAVPVRAAGSAGFSMKASEQTLHRGSTVTLTVSVSSTEPATSYGLQLSYDSSVFELVNGTTNASGALVNSFNNGFAFMFQTATAYSGSVGTVTLRVKDNAVYGNYTITGTASVKNGSTTISATGCSVTVSVECKHSYGAWSKVDGTNHIRTCSACQDVQKVAHTWNSGTVTKKATCKETGIKTYTCTGCNATKTETIAKLTTHAYGKWTKVNATTHKHICSVCSKEEIVAHTWNSGTVTKKATCKETGIKTYTCTGCNVTKTETIAKLQTHTYDHDCDVDCNVCGAVRVTKHNYKSSWNKDKTQHWKECSACKDKKDIATHIPGEEATEAKAQTCTVCDYIITPALGHTHKYATDWTTDASGHWNVCSGCEQQGNFEQHAFENECDKDCSICGYTREVAHSYGQTWCFDAKNHWHECSSCKDTKNMVAHVPGAEATELTAQTCTICGCEIVPALGGKSTEPPVDETKAPTETPNDNLQKGSFPSWLTTVLVAVLVAVVEGAIFIVIIKRKERNR